MNTISSNIFNMQEKRTILIVDNDLIFLSNLKEYLEGFDFIIYSCSTPFEAEEIIRHNSIHLVITDLRLLDDDDPGDKWGLRLSEIAPLIPKIVLTGYMTFEDFGKVLSRRSNRTYPQVLDYLNKGYSLDTLLERITEIFDKQIRINTPQVFSGGALTDQNAAYYIEREAEREAILFLQKMEYVLVIEPSQQGKTSFINFLMRHPSLVDKFMVYIDTSSLDHLSEESWYKSICLRIIEQMEAASLGKIYPSIPRNGLEFRQYLQTISKHAKKMEKGIIIALDEIGFIRFPNSLDFFKVIRDIYNSRQSEPSFLYITFILSGSILPYDNSNDQLINPINNTKRVRLKDFSRDQIFELVNRLEWTRKQTDIICNRVFYWTKGQPYLTNKICEKICVDTNVRGIDKIVSQLQIDDDNHIPSIIKTIIDDNKAKTFIKRILTGEKIVFYPVTDHEQSKLEFLGILVADSDGNCMIRNRIYKNALLILDSAS